MDQNIGRKIEKIDENVGRKIVSLIYLMTEFIVITF